MPYKIYRHTISTAAGSIHLRVMLSARELVVVHWGDCAALFGVGALDRLENLHTTLVTTDAFGCRMSIKLYAHGVVETRRWSDSESYILSLPGVRDALRTAPSTPALALVASHTSTARGIKRLAAV